MLFSSTAGAGHFGPLEPVAQACRQRGHDVVVTAPASFAAHVERTGLTFRSFPDVPADVMGAMLAQLPSLPMEEANRLVVTEVFGRLDPQAGLPAMLDLVSDWRPDIVVRDPAEFASLVAAERFDVPQAQVAIGIGPGFGPWLDLLDDPIRALEALAGVAAPVGADLVASTPTLSSVPPGLDGAATGDGSRPTAPVWRYRPSSKVAESALPQDFGNAADPLVYVTFGSVTATIGPFAAVYPAVVTALSALPIRVLLTVGTGYDLAQLGTLPANTLATQWWPQDAVMAEAALVVGHGGFGTTMTAIASGVPQIVVPLFASDQFVNAERIEAVGAGRQLVGPDRIGELAMLVQEMLADPRYAEAARLIADEMAALPDVASMVDVLQGLAR